MTEQNEQYLETIKQLEELIVNVCRWPAMFVVGEDFYSVCAFICGYMAAVPATDDLLNKFNPWLADKLGFPPNLAWPYGMTKVCPDRSAALTELPKLFAEFFRDKDCRL
jgi:hypothetical protein